CGKKPLCLEEFQLKNTVFPNKPRHSFSVACRAAATLWKNKCPSDSDIIIHIYDSPDPLMNGAIPILVIHRPLFFEIFNKNLTLFQSILGPQVTAQTLLNMLTSASASFSSTLKNNNLLI